MLDIKLVRTHPERLKSALIRRGDVRFSDPVVQRLCSTMGVPAERCRVTLSALLTNLDQVPLDTIEALAVLDAERRACLYEVEQLKANRNKVSQEVARRKIARESADDLLAGMKQVSEHIKMGDEKTATIDAQFQELMLALPNVPHDSVPLGGGDQENEVVRAWGTPPTFSFPAQDHVDLAAGLGILDLDRAAKLTGSRFSVLLGQGARLERALIDFMIDLHTREHGYTEMWPPLMVNAASMKGTGQLPKFAEDLFRIQHTDYYLISTAEVPLTNFYAGEIFSETALPIKYTAYTPCFRSEAGSYGKDTRGLIRQHQFDKVELVTFAHPERSYDELESLVASAEEVLKRLGLPYRVNLLSTGDLGFSASKTYDLEVWLPSQQTYREISSCSTCEDFQARRANIRFKGPEKGSKPQFVHTLNGSGLAIGRTWLAILENFQDEGGRVCLPEVLRSYFGGATHLEQEPQKR